MEAAEEYGIYEDGRHYDLMFPGTKAGMPFWQEEAEAVGGKILELACGTGRVCIPLARAGFDITGIDLSSAMLREAKQKTQSEGLTARWIEGDIRRFQGDVGSRDERLASSPSQDKDLNIRCRVDPVAALDESLVHLPGHGVAGFRAVKGQVG